MSPRKDIPIITQDQLSVDDYQVHCDITLQNLGVRKAVLKGIEGKFAQKHERWRQLENEANILSYIQSGRYEFQHNIVKFYGIFSQGKIFRLFLEDEDMYNCEELMTRLSKCVISSQTMDNFKSSMVHGVLDAMQFLHTRNPKVYHLNLTRKTVSITAMDLVTKLTSFEYAVLAKDAKRKLLLPPDTEHLPIEVSTGKKRKTFGNGWDEYSFGKFLEWMFVTSGNKEEMDSDLSQAIKDLMSSDQQNRPTFDDLQIRLSQQRASMAMLDEDEESILEACKSTSIQEVKEDVGEVEEFPSTLNQAEPYPEADDSSSSSDDGVMNRNRRNDGNFGVLAGPVAFAESNRYRVYFIWGSTLFILTVAIALAAFGYTSIRNEIAHLREDMKTGRTSIENKITVLRENMTKSDADLKKEIIAILQYKPKDVTEVEKTIGIKRDMTKSDTSALFANAYLGRLKTSRYITFNDAIYWPNEKFEPTTSNNKGFSLDTDYYGLPGRKGTSRAFPERKGKQQE